MINEEDKIWVLLFALGWYRLGKDERGGGENLQI
jgi:hypothetical protein